MIIHLLHSPATPDQSEEMLQTLKTYIKLAVDIKLGILAGGGAMHADCEAILLNAGSKQEDIWGANWDPATKEVRYESLINIRPRQNNPSMEILDATIRSQVEEIVKRLFGEI